MPPSPLSIQEVLERRRRETFVGRDAQLDCFREQLSLSADDPRRRFVLSVFGQGGVGKSTLLRQYLRLAANAGAAAALSNDLEGDGPAAMARLAEQLGAAAGGDPFRAFNERYTTFRRRRDELESQPDAPQGLAGLFARTATRVGAKVLRNTVPGSDLALDILEEPLADQASQWAEFVRRKLGNRDETQLVLEPAAVLSPLFVQGLAALAGGRRVALLFDTYERTAPFLDGWLRELLEGRHGLVPADVTFVMAGRAELDRNAWAEMEELIVRLSLDPFSDAVARDFLARRGITQPQVIDVILKLSGRLPLLLATLAAESPTDPARVGDATGTAVERFLSWVDDPARRELALNAALPRQLDRDVVAVLGGDATGFDWLVANPFVERRADGWAYHDVVRGQMVRYQRKASPAAWTALHEALAAYYRAMRDQLATDAKEGADNSRWREAARGELYHRLCARPDGALAGALNEIAQALDMQWDLARKWAEILVEVGQDAGHEVVQGWGEKLSKGLTFKRFDADAQIAMLSHLTSYNGLEATQRSIVLTIRGNRYGYRHRTDDALADFEQAIALDPLASRPFLDRAGLYARLGRTDEALADFGKAIEKNPQASQAILARARFLAKLQRTDEALADFEQAIMLNAQDPWPLAERARFYRNLRRNAEALADHNRAVTLDPQGSLPFVERAEFFIEMRRYDEALADLNRAVALDPQEAWPLGERAEFFMEMRRYDEALVDFCRALELDPQYDWAIIGQGQVYRALERYDEALAEFDRAIELDPQFAWAIAIRGETYWSIERYDEALTDFDRAIDLNPDEDWAIYLRAITRRVLNAPDWRIDLDRALVLAQTTCEGDPANTINRLNLALYYLAAGDEAAAAARYNEVLPRATAFELSGALRDLDDYLRLFPDAAAARLRALLQAAGGATGDET